MAEVIRGILPSRCLRRNIPYNVVLPAGYSATRSRFPVLYLLHGLFGDLNNWIELTSLLRYADLHDLILVTPEGSDSWYVDSAATEDDRFESYFLKDLIPTIDASFRTIDSRRSRGIAGLSMGGYGSLKFALKRPDLFAFASSSSGALNGPRLSEVSGFNGWEEMRPSIVKAFGKPGNRSRMANDLFRIVADFDSRRYPTPQIIMDCGKLDSFLEVNREFSSKLTELRILHSYKEFAGGHDWGYWNRRLRNILKISSELLV